VRESADVRGLAEEAGVANSRRAAEYRRHVAAPLKGIKNNRARSYARNTYAEGFDRD
jgi:hypothetical protein